MDFKEKIWPLKDRLYRMALRLLEDRSEAEDVAQEVMIKLWQKRKDLSSINNIDAWSFRLTKNLALDKLKGGYHKRKTSIDQVIDFPTKNLSPDRQIESNDSMTFIKQKMQLLPEQHRLVMHLRDIEELSYQEICDALNMSMAQVKSNLFRARQAMRVELNTWSNIPKSKKHG